MIDNLKEQNGVLLQGHIKISDPVSGEIIVNKRNAIHYENMSISLAESLANAGEGFVYTLSLHEFRLVMGVQVLIQQESLHT